MSPETHTVHKPTFGQRFPIDLVLVAAVVGGTYGALLLDIGGMFRVFLGAVTACFLPGYVTAAALFPRHGEETRPRRGHGDRTRIDLRERAVIAVGLSVAVLPILGLAAGQVFTEFTETAVFGVVAGYVVVVGAAAAFRRLQLPENQRLYVPFSGWVTELQEGVTTGSTANRVLTVALVCSVVLAAGVLAFAVATPMNGETYTDFHLVTEDGDELVSAGYPETLTRGDPTDLTWGIESHEATETDYTVVVMQERVTEQDGETVRIEVTQLDRTSTTVAPGDGEQYAHEVTPVLVGENLRIGYYLYRGDAPETPTEEDAYRHLHIWVDVESGA